MLQQARAGATRSCVTKADNKVLKDRTFFFLGLGASAGASAALGASAFFSAAGAGAGAAAGAGGGELTPSLMTPGSASVAGPQHRLDSR